MRFIIYRLSDLLHVKYFDKIRFCCRLLVCGRVKAYVYHVTGVSHVSLANYFKQFKKAGVLSPVVYEINILFKFQHTHDFVVL